MLEKPPVSCMCLTYGRPQRIVEEAIESFLRQDYKGEKEMIVLNDFDEQEYVFEHPEVKIINTNKRFRTVGEKRNASAALSSHDILFVWDDDDIYLPNRISYSVKMMQDVLDYKDFFKASRAFILTNGVVEGPEHNLFHSGSAWTKSLFDSIKGYKHMGSGQDTVFEEELVKINQRPIFEDIPLEDIYYLYRYAGTGSFHLSGFGRDMDGGKLGNQKVFEHTQNKIRMGWVKTGTLHLKPHWEKDYVQMVNDYIKILKKASNG